MISVIQRWLLPGVPMLAFMLAACGGAAAPTATPTKAAAAATTTAPATVATATPAAAAPTPTRVAAAPAATTVPSVAKPSGKVTIVLADASVQTLNPNYGLGNNPPTYFLFESLVDYDLESRAEGRLATAWETSESAKIWEFKLRPGVKFHNGDSMTAEDVKFSFDNALTDPRSTTGGATRQWIDRVEVVDPLTVRFRLTKPGSGFEFRVGAVVLLPKGYFEKIGVEKFTKEAPVGTGPFKFVDRRLDEFMSFEAFEGHWRRSPFVKNVTVRLAAEPSVRLAMLKTGEADVMGGVTPLQAQEINNTRGLRTIRAMGTSLMWLWTFGASTIGKDGLNVPRPDSPWANKLVRQAANYAIDRDAIVKGLFRGDAAPMVTVVMPGAFGFNPNLKPYPYDPKKARELLAQAGYPDGFTTDLYSTPHAAINFTEETTVAVAKYFADVGIKADVKKMDYGSYLANVRQRTIEGLGVIASSFRPDGSDAMDSWATNKGWGTGGASDHLNAGLDKVYSEVDRAKRETMIQELMAMEWEIASNIFLVYGNTTYGVNSRVRDWPLQRGNAYLKRVDLLQLAE